MLDLDVVEGLHRIEDSFVNWYLLEEDGRFTAVDAGLPASYDSLQEALRLRGAGLEALEAVVLTHAHFDHVGFAEKVRSERGVPVWVHEEEVELTKHPLRYGKERHPIFYMWRPATLKIIATMARSGALWAPRIKEVRTYRDGQTLDVPGRPRVVFTPGHTFGHCSLHLPDKDALIAGDAVVTLNPYTGGRGPQIVARAATADTTRALGSLDRLAETGARTVLTGHGPVWHQGAERIAEAARGAGIT